MTSLWTSDIHLNANPRDSYRWDILPWLEAEAKKQGVDLIGIGGDLTDGKDKHPSSLVNRVVDFFYHSKHRWEIVFGNHDGTDPYCPFFRFLGNLDNVRVANRPVATKAPIDGKFCDILYLPSTKNWEEEWGPHLEYGYDYIFMHGTFAGTKAETGFELSGIPVDFFPPDSFGFLYSGDIHIPGEIADRMYYIGSPFRCHFGDTYQPRVVHIAKEATYDLFPNLKSRHVLTIREVADFDKFHDLREGDQVKLRIRLKRADFPEWRKIRNMIASAAEGMGLEVCGVEWVEMTTVRRRIGEPQPAISATHKTPEEYLNEYAKKQEWSKGVTEFGHHLLNG